MNVTCAEKRLRLTTALASYSSGAAVRRIEPRLRGLVLLAHVIDALLDVTGQAEECFLHIDVTLSRHFQEWYPELIGESLTLFSGNYSLLFPIALVTDKDLVDTFRCVLFHIRKPGTNIYERGQSGAR